jgi:non-ribosomal peptide synthetase component F
MDKELRAREDGNSSIIINPARVTQTLCLHKLFEQVVCEVPDRTAIVDTFGHRLSYRELNRRSNQLARRLRTIGISPERRVGIFLDHTVDLLVAVLAVLKADGAFVPLDRRLPRDRLLSTFSNPEPVRFLQHAR